MTGNQIANRVRSLLQGGTRQYALTDQSNDILLEKVSEAAYQLSIDHEIFRNRAELILTEEVREVPIPSDCYIIQECVLTAINGTPITPRKYLPTTQDAALRLENLGFNKDVAQFGQTFEFEDGRARVASNNQYYIMRRIDGTFFAVTPSIVGRFTILYHQFIAKDYINDNPNIDLPYSDFFIGAITYRAAELAAYSLADALVEASLEKRNTFNLKIQHYKEQQQYYLDKMLKPYLRSETQSMTFKPDYFFPE